MPKLIDYVCSSCGQVVEEDVYYGDNEKVEPKIMKDCECGCTIALKQFPSFFIMEAWDV